MTFDKGWAFAERHMPAVRAAIGAIPTRVFFDVDTAPVERDRHEATDLVLRLTGGDVAVRVRSKRSLWKDTPEWSVRWRAANGGRTEIHKLRDGYCRWYLTGYSDGNDGLWMWWLLDLNAVRAACLLEDESLWQIHNNEDGTFGGYLPIRVLEEVDCVAYSGNDELESRPYFSRAGVG
jgi:hypothetical protein